MQNRLKQIRKKLGCNQNEFAEKLGISVSNISSYEAGRRNPSDAVINLICEKFSVNKEWLETGNGEMFIQKTENEKISCRCTESRRRRSDVQIHNRYFRTG